MTIPQRPQRMENEGPTTKCIINGVALGWTNCTPCSFAMGMNKVSLGRIDIDGCTLRRQTGDTSGGTTINQCRTAAEHWGIKTEVHTGSGVCSPFYLAVQLQGGRGAAVQGNAGALVHTAFRSTAGPVNHCIYVNEARGGTTGVPKEVLVYDPAADGRMAGWGRATQGPQWWPWDILLRFMAALQPTGSGPVLGPDKVYCGIFADTEPHFHAKFGGVSTSPFPDDVFGRAGTTDVTRTVRSGPGSQYPAIRVLAVGARFGAYQLVAGGAAGPADDWMGDHNGIYWISTNGVTGRGT